MLILMTLHLLFDIWPCGPVVHGVLASSHTTTTLLAGGRGRNAAAGECLPSDSEYSHFFCFSNTATPTTSSQHQQSATTASTTTTKTGGTGCFDSNPECPAWAQRGECEQNPAYMLFECRYSCQTCLDGHAGVTQLAPPDRADDIVTRWRQTQNYLQGLANQTTTRHYTIHCRNQHELCTFWAVAGECEQNQQYMKENCAPACQACL